MIVRGNDRLRNVHGLTQEENDAAIGFIRSLVEDWLNNHQPNDSFRAVDLMGRHVFPTWADTPLDALYRYYYRKRPDNTYAVRQAGIAAGYLLKRVIEEDTHHRFEFRQEYKGLYILQ